MKVLVVCAHADDEVIAIGGTLRKLADSGASIRLLMFSKGAEGYTELEQRDEIISIRDKETHKVCKLLGIQEYFNLQELDWNLKVNNRTYHAVIHHIRQYKPELVFTHSRADYNDHINVHDVTVEGMFHAGIPCAMQEGDPWKTAALYEFEVLKAMDTPSLIVDITDTFDAKVEAMSVYASQHNLVGGVFQLMEGRALERGSLIGVKYGEALTENNYLPKAVFNIKSLINK